MARKARGGSNGRPAFKPTDDDRKTVSLMCAVGIPHEGIALCVGDGIDDKTLRKHFAKELETAKIKANAKVGGSVFNAAIKGAGWACNLWTKTQMGWSETIKAELTGKDGKDLGPTIDLTKLTDEQLAAFRVLVAAATPE